MENKIAAERKNRIIEVSSSEGTVFRIGDTVNHEDPHTEGTAVILSFEWHEEHNEIKAHTTRGWAHIDFIYKEEECKIT